MWVAAGKFAKSFKQDTICWVRSYLVLKQLQHRKKEGEPGAVTVAHVFFSSPLPPFKYLNPWASLEDEAFRLTYRSTLPALQAAGLCAGQYQQQVLHTAATPVKLLTSIEEVNSSVMS